MAFDLKPYQDPLTIQRVLYSAKTVAVLGLSSNHLRPSYFVAFYLKRHGYTMIPVNPKETEILGQRSYPSLIDVPEPIDIVDVFRRPEDTPAIADDAVTKGAKALWLQTGISSEDAAARAKAGGLMVVMDTCIGATHSLLRIARKAQKV